MKINIKGLDKAALLAGLFNSSKPLGLGFLDSKAKKEMTYEEAQQYVKSGKLSFDYLNGRVMKIDISGDVAESRLYDLDNGEGAAQRVADAVKNGVSLSSKLPVPTNQVEKLASEGKGLEAVKAADTYISIFSLNTTRDNSQQKSAQKGNFNERLKNIGCEAKDIPEKFFDPVTGEVNNNPDPKLRAELEDFVTKQEIIRAIAVPRASM